MGLRMQYILLHINRSPAIKILHLYFSKDHEEIQLFPLVSSCEIRLVAAPSVIHISPSLEVIHILYFFDYRTEVFPFQNNPKNLDPSCKMDLDFWDSFGKENPNFFCTIPYN